jgi:hypothetical protein
MKNWLVLLFLVACAAQIPAIPPVVIQPVPGVEETPVTYNGITGIAALSSCAKIKWKDRGTAPIGYTKGMALVYAKALCDQKRSDVVLVSKAKTESIYDALNWFGVEFSNKKMDNSKDGPDSLRHTFVLLIGLGLRESSGKHCEGRDMSATNVSADTTEAGLFQTSYNSRVFSSELPKLHAKYKASNSGCFYDVFHEGVKCTEANLKNWGEGEGVTFQKMSKGCPAYAAEYAAVMLRVKRSHYGPLNTRSAEIRTECNDLLKKVESMISEQPAICGALK